MTTSVSICSNALVMLGGAPISSLDEENPRAQAAANLYPSVRDTVLRAHYWNCATKRDVLAPLATAPAFGYTNQFPLPGDWLRTIQVGRDDCPLDYRSEGTRILANVAALPLVYVFRNYVEDTWSTNLVHVMELAMAAKLAYSVTASTSLADMMNTSFERQLKVAKAIDGQDDPPEEFGAGPFLLSRFS